MRKIKFVNSEYYHIYNRGVDKREIFCNEKDYLRFISGMREFNDIKPIGSLCAKIKKSKREETSKRFLEEVSKALVEIVCYSLVSNHYHFILKQLVDQGISKFMLKLGMGYANYFNQKYDRSGSLFQGTFKAVHIDINEYLLWVSGYINGNVEIHKIAKAENYKWCSYPDYLNKKNSILCDKKIILSQFKNFKEYQEFVEMVIIKSGKRKDMKKYFIE